MTNNIINKKQRALRYETQAIENPVKRGPGRPKKCEIEQIDASPEQLAKAIFLQADTAPEQAENDDDENPTTVWICI